MRQKKESKNCTRKFGNSKKGHQCVSFYFLKDVILKAALDHKMKAQGKHQIQTKHFQKLQRRKRIISENAEKHRRQIRVGGNGKSKKKKARESERKKSRPPRCRIGGKMKRRDDPASTIVIQGLHPHPGPARRGRRYTTKTKDDDEEATVMPQIPLD